MIKSRTVRASLVWFIAPAAVVVFLVMAVDMCGSSDEPPQELIEELESQHDVEQILRRSGIFQTQELAEVTGNWEKIDLNISNLIDEVDARPDDLAAKLEAQKEAERKAVEEEAVRKAAEEARRQPATVPTHEGCRGPLVVSGIRSTKYFDAYEGDYRTWIEFYNAVRLEGTGVGLNGRYYRYDSITTNKAISPSYTKEQLEDSIAGGDGWPYVRHTMAADLAVNPLGTRYYLDWGEDNPWNGIYVVEDTGEGLHGWHLDIYTGFGRSDMLASPIGPHVNVYTTDC